MGERWKVPVKSNKDLIEIAFEQIEKETGFHIIMIMNILKKLIKILYVNFI